MDTYVFQLILIMIAGGLAGGFVGHSIDTIGGSGKGRGLPFHLLLGIFGSFSVPLFLNMVSSRLLTEGKSDPLSILYFFSICFLFSVLPTRLFPKGKPASEPPSVPPEKDRRERSAAVRETATEKKDGPSEGAEAGPPPPNGVVSENEYKIIRIVSQKKRAGTSFASLLKESGMSEKEFNEALSLMMAKGYIGQELSDSDKPNFSLTRKGLRLFSQYGRD
jgi:predicted transcriptional regulator